MCTSSAVFFQAAMLMGFICRFATIQFPLCVCRSTAFLRSLTRHGCGSEVGLQECSKHGAVDKVVIPRPKDGLDPPGVGKAYIRFLSIEGSQKAQQALQGRTFGDNKVAATFISESDFAAVSR